jgi:ribosomal protein L12E/L44/L45/RPP1/RPP2
MFTIDEMNSVLRRFAVEDADKRMQEYVEELEDLQMFELLRQQEMMQRASELEDFSPFDTCNS